MKQSPLWWRRLKAAVTPRRFVKVIEGDGLPTRLPLWDLIVAREDNEDWSVGMRCPCGCGYRLEMMLLKNVKPRWQLSVSERGYPSLHPSVWLSEGCRSHFWLREGKVVWCD